LPWCKQAESGKRARKRRDRPFESSAESALDLGQKSVERKDLDPLLGPQSLRAEVDDSAP
jgi:hypothetical protein